MSLLLDLHSIEREERTAMKHGRFFFWHLYYIILVARLGVIPLFAFCLWAPLYVPGWIAFAISFAVTVVTVFLRIPSPRAMMDFIDSKEEKFCHRVDEGLAKKTFAKVDYIKAYSPDGMRQRIDGEIITSELILVAVVRAKDEVWMAVETQTLIHPVEEEYEEFRIFKPESIEVHRESDDRDNKMVYVTMMCDGRELEVLVKQDYHLNDFIALLKGEV